MNICPKCGAPLQENAQFCPHCMTVLAEKKEVKKPEKPISNKRRAVIIITAVLLALAVAAGGIFTAIYKKKHSPVCPPEQFKAAVVKTSERADADGLWNADGFIDTHDYTEKNIVRYSTKTYLENAVISVFFYNGGEEVYAYFSDVEANNFESAELLFECVTQSVCNNYFTDLHEVFTNEAQYPKSDFPRPFYSEFTDLLGKTQQYNADLAAGAKLSTRYITATDGEFQINYFITERIKGDETLYDLALEIEKA